MKKRLLVSLAIISLAMSGVAFAEEETAKSDVKKSNLQDQREELRKERSAIQEERKAAIEAKKEERQQKKEETIEQKCARIQERIMERSANFDGKNAKHMSVYKNMTERITKFIGKLSEQGYDVTKIEADLVVLNEKIQKFSTDFTAQNAKVREIKGLACGHSDGEFKDGITEARTMLKTVHEDAMDIRKFMLTTVRPDIQALRQQKVDIVKSEDEAETETEKPELE